MSSVVLKSQGGGSTQLAEPNSLQSPMAFEDGMMGSKSPNKYNFLNLEGGSESGSKIGMGPRGSLSIRGS